MLRYNLQHVSSYAHFQEDKLYFTASGIVTLNFQQKICGTLKVVICGAGDLSLSALSG